MSIKKIKYIFIRFDKYFIIKIAGKRRTPVILLIRKGKGIVIHMKKITIQDIARRARVAPSTVSLALNGNSRVADKTRARVLAVAHKLHYMLNPAGQTLKKNTSRIILFVVGLKTSFDGNPVVYKVFDGVLEEACAMGYQVMWGRFLLHESSFESCLAYNPCGLITVSLNRDILSRVRKYQPNVVIIEHPDDMAGVDYICVDNFEAGYLAGQRLAALGHRMIYFMTGRAGGRLELLRREGFFKALAEAGIHSKPDWIHHTDGYSIQAGYQAACNLFSAGPLPTAVFMSSGDETACGFVQACRDHGIRVPEDLSVVGFDNTMAAYCSPPLTTIGKPLAEFGRIAVRLIAQKAEGTLEGIPQKVLLPPAWLEGKSTAPCRQNQK